MTPAYLKAYESGVLERRIDQARKWLNRCTLCPRMCRVNRAGDETGFCLTGRYAIVASYGPHFGEERPLVGRYGSGTIFFCGCNLMCMFCQNYDISHTRDGTAVTPNQLAEIMLWLQKQGCHNINFVTPTHVIPQILESLPPAIEKGLNVPLVYNSSAYDRVPALRLLDGVFDIYMPDFKFWKSESAAKWCTAPDYPRRAREALKEMYRQVGDLAIRNGIAERGLLVRHLVMPGCVDETREILRFLATEISVHTYVNIMDQYRPCGEAFNDPLLRRRITGDEYLSALEFAREVGLTRLDDRRSFLLWSI
ncbi:MAG: radical SAM protein [Deltaproteobacteria bacterium]|nr:radical SAM protein [Deltaproteobacteria bacterium]MBW2068313.1 radical SAM protein [Deltaproteobacteria bacterium]